LERGWERERERTREKTAQAEKKKGTRVCPEPSTSVRKETSEKRFAADGQDGGIKKARPRKFKTRDKKKARWGYREREIPRKEGWEKRGKRNNPREDG